MRKINVYWIEDNPVRGECDFVDGVKVPRFWQGDLFQYFIFQHPLEVRDYLKIVSEMTDKQNALSLSSYLVPDIVVFDYKLSDAFAARNKDSLKLSNEIQLKFALDHSVVYKHKDQVELDLEYSPLLDDESEFKRRYELFKNELEVENISKLDDEFGLYCGLSVIRELKDYITIGVPASINSPARDEMHSNSAFYEWLNSYDLKGAIERYDRTDKSWKKIIPFGVNLLRNRILQQLQDNKIFIDLNNIIKLLDCFSSKEGIDSLSDKSLRFKSTYGWQELPLNGLFIDCKIDPNWNGEKKSKKLNELTDTFDRINKELEQAKKRLNNARTSNSKAERLKDLHGVEAQQKQLDTQIKLFTLLSEREYITWEFLNGILRRITEDKSHKKITGVYNIVNQLFAQFDSDEFYDRIVLADYLKRAEHFALNEDEWTKLKQLREKFGVHKNKLTKMKEFHLETLCKDEETAKLVTFFASVRLWKRYVDFKIMVDSEKSKFHDSAEQHSENMKPPNRTDLLLLLFPMYPQSPSLFNKLGELDNSFYGGVGSKTQTLMGFAEADFNRRSDRGGLDISNLMTFGEFRLTQAYAYGLGFTDENLPIWLQAYK